MWKKVRIISSPCIFIISWFLFLSPVCFNCQTVQYFMYFPFFFKKKKISAIQSYIVHSSVLLKQAEMLHRIFLDSDRFSSSSFGAVTYHKQFLKIHIYLLRVAFYIHKQKPLGILVYFSVSSSEIRYKTWKCSSL